MAISAYMLPTERAVKTACTTWVSIMDPLLLRYSPLTSDHLIRDRGIAGEPPRDRWGNK